MRPAAFAVPIILRLVKGRHLRMGLRVKVAEQELHHRLCDTVIPVCNSKNEEQRLDEEKEWRKERGVVARTQVMNDDEGGHEAKERD